MSVIRHKGANDPTYMEQRNGVIEGGLCIVEEMQCIEDVSYPSLRR
jgi:hypothetical protein